jgi:exonuclease III
VLNYLKTKHPGIVFLQETHTTSGDQIIWKNDWKGDIFMSHGSSHSKGVAILIPNNLDYQVNDTELDSEGRYILLNGIFCGKRMSLLNYYAPTCTDKKEQLRYFDKILPLINENHENLVLAGDLNVHLNPSMDKKGGKTALTTAYADRILQTMQELNLIDIWRLCNPDTHRYTWRENTAHGIIQSRLDYFICPNSYLYHLKECQIENSIYSDHNPITLDLYIENEPTRGKGSWKFNTSLLSDTTYVNKIKEKLNEYKERYKNTKDHCLIWDTAKAEIRGISISHASYINRQRNMNLTNLNDELTKLELMLANNPNDNTLQQCATIKKEIEEINNHITKGIMIRAKAKYIDQNEGNTKLFLGLEKSKAKIKNISKLIINKNCTVTDPNEILEEEQKFYKALYQDNANYQDAERLRETTCTM